MKRNSLKKYRFKRIKSELLYVVKSKKRISELWSKGKGGRTSLPWAFTEQGIYIREELNEIVMSQNVISPNENYFSGQGGESRKLPYAILNRVSILIHFLKGLFFNSL